MRVTIMLVLSVIFLIGLLVLDWRIPHDGGRSEEEELSQKTEADDHDND